MLTIQVIHRSDASSVIRSHCADQDLFWSSVTELKQEIDARWRHFDFEHHHWVVMAEARAQLVEYLRRMEAAYGAQVEVGYETDEARTIREDGEHGEEQRSAAEAERAEEQRRQYYQRHQRQKNRGAKEQARAGRGKRTRRQEPEGEPCAPFHRRMSAEQAFATLYLTPDAPPEMVQAAWRALAKIHHPDVGGDAAVMARINDAYGFLQDAFKQRVDAA